MNFYNIIFELGNNISNDINDYLINEIKKDDIKNYKLDLSNVLLENNKVIKNGIFR